ncbi:MAG: heavy metal-associated domain-containing protein [Wenzhouxiangellaceae bacterium]
MKTTVIEVAGLLSTLSAAGVEKQLLRLPGVQKAEVNYVAGSATISFDENVVDLKAIKAKVHECGYHCGGEQLPRHVCVPDDPPGEAQTAVLAADASHEHAAHSGTGPPRLARTRRWHRSSSWCKPRRTPRRRHNCWPTRHRNGLSSPLWLLAC